MAARYLFRISEDMSGKPMPMPEPPSPREDLDVAEEPVGLLGTLLGSSVPSGVTRALEKLEKREERLGDSRRPRWRF